MYSISLVISLSHTQDSQERLFPDRLQQQASIKQQLVNVYVNFLFSHSSVMATEYNVSLCSEEVSSD